MNSRSVRLTSFLVMMSLSGCSTFDCCHWWGRNTDGSSNLGKKPSPVQQGPIAGTYSNPGVANTTSPVQPMIQPATAPVVTTSPAQTYSPAVEQNNPVMTPPSPPSSPLQTATPSTPPGPPSTSMQMDYRSNPSSAGSFPPSQLPTAIMTDLPENKPSIPSPVPPTPQVTGPTLPGATRVESSPMPLLLAPQGSVPQINTDVTMPTQPTIAMPEVAAPTIGKPADIAPPKGSMPGKNATLNPGTTPPPLPPPPAIPVLEGKDRK